MSSNSKKTISKTKTKTNKRKNAKNKVNNCNNNNNNNLNICENDSTQQSDKHLITDYFPTLSSSRKRLPSKVLALQKEKIIRHYISSKCDPIDSLTIEDIDIKGKGVMASKPISKGSFICEYSGDLVGLKEAKLRELEYESVGAGCYMYYFNWSNTVWCVDATHPTGRYGRLINHSRKSPNCKTRVFVHNGRPHLIFIAIKDIEQNQEILYDYGERDKFAIEAHPWLSST